jgi:hypothetical protein
VGRPASVLGWRAAAAAADGVLLGLYYAFHGSLVDTSTWGDVAVVALLLMPAVFLLVYLALPLWRAPGLQLLLVGVAFGVLALLLRQAGLEAPGDFAKLGAMTAIAWWFLDYFESASWVVIVALIVPWVDAYSVWRGPTSNIVHNHRQVFTTLSFAFPIPGEQNAANLGLPDLLFFALFLGAAARFALRPLLTWACLVASFGGTIALAVWFDLAGLPALPLLALGFLLPNADVLWRSVRDDRASGGSRFARGSGERR